MGEKVKLRPMQILQNRQKYLENAKKALAR